MEALSDLSSIIRVLRKGIRDGRWTLEDLDKPSRGFELAKKEYLTRNPLSNGQWKGVVHKNLLREHPIQEAVEYAPDKKELGRKAF